ncbi:MAG: DinB family protein [Acidobacteriota bacterium]|nr:DinB family protein [Acidobacteriota bacterium]
MKISDTLLGEFDHEMSTTRKLLERVPEDKWDWTPHEKSMKMGRLACHVAELPYFATFAAKSDSMDFAKGEYKMVEAANRQQLLEAFDKLAAAARAAIAASSDEDLLKPWSLMMDSKALLTMPKAGILRTVMMNHLIHHRGQLSVYLRLTDTPVPSIYGPSADEGGM